jgi:PIN domain nuclease of toxin-antitoxin system
VVGGGAFLPAARSAVEAASASGRLFISAISAWEIGLLMARGRLKSVSSAIDFFHEMVARTGSDVCEVSAAIFANSSFLPHFDNRDPADCLLVSTARMNDMTIVTRDRKILAYGVDGYVKSMAC